MNLAVENLLSKLLIRNSCIISEKKCLDSIAFMCYVVVIRVQKHLVFRALFRAGQSPSLEAWRY